MVVATARQDEFSGQQFLKLLLILVLFRASLIASLRPPHRKISAKSSICFSCGHRSLATLQAEMAS